MEDTNRPDVVYVAIDPQMDDPLFATDDEDAIAEWVDSAPDRYYHELGLVDADEVQDLMERFGN